MKHVPRAFPFVLTTPSIPRWAAAPATAGPTQSWSWDPKIPR